MSRKALSPESDALAGDGWWFRAPQLASRIPNLRSLDVASAHYQFGDAFLQLDSDYLPLLDALERDFRECAVPPARISPGHCVRCSVYSTKDPSIQRVTFHEPRSMDSMELALSLLQHPILNPFYAESVSPLPVWRLIRSAMSPYSPLLMARGEDALVDFHETPAEFLTDFLVTPVLSMQQELLFIHAASVGLRGAGVVLIGASGTGKTTTSLTLASRGHDFLGDDYAAIRAKSGEILPFRRSVNIRPGPRGRLVDTRLKEICSGRAPEDTSHLQIHVSELFHDAMVAPVPLRYVFFLRGFASRPSVKSFAPRLDSLMELAPRSLDFVIVSGWGISSRRRLMQFMVFMKLLSKLKCYFLKVGPPEETADLIEKTTEGL